jgi:hypothetical protein
MAIESFQETYRPSFFFSQLTNRSGEYLTLIKHDIMKYSAKNEFTLRSTSLGDSTLKYKCKGLKIAQLLMF